MTKVIKMNQSTKHHQKHHSLHSQSPQFISASPWSEMNTATDSTPSHPPRSLCVTDRREGSIHGYINTSHHECVRSQFYIFVFPTCTTKIRKPNLCVCFSVANQTFLADPAKMQINQHSDQVTLMWLPGGVSHFTQLCSLSAFFFFFLPWAEKKSYIYFPVITVVQIPSKCQIWKVRHHHSNSVHSAALRSAAHRAYKMLRLQNWERWFTRWKWPERTTDGGSRFICSPWIFLMRA